MSLAGKRPRIAATSASTRARGWVVWETTPRHCVAGEGVELALLEDHRRGRGGKALDEAAHLDVIAPPDHDQVTPLAEERAGHVVDASHERAGRVGEALAGPRPGGVAHQVRDSVRGEDQLGSPRHLVERADEGHLALEGAHDERVVDDRAEHGHWAEASPRTHELERVPHPEAEPERVSNENVHGDSLRLESHRSSPLHGGPVPLGKGAGRGYTFLRAGRGSTPVFRLVDLHKGPEDSRARRLARRRRSVSTTIPRSRSSRRARPLASAST